MKKTKHAGVGQTSKGLVRNIYFILKLKQAAVSISANSINFICFLLLNKIKAPKNICWFMQTTDKTFCLNRCSASWWL